MACLVRGVMVLQLCRVVAVPVRSGEVSNVTEGCGRLRMVSYGSYGEFW